MEVGDDAEGGGLLRVVDEDCVLRCDGVDHTVGEVEGGYWGWGWWI